MGKSRGEVRNEILRDIRDGRYEAVILLPTHLEMSRLYGVSTHTIKEAVRELVKSGDATVRPSVGTIARVPEPTPDEEDTAGGERLAPCGVE